MLPWVDVEEPRLLSNSGGQATTRVEVFFFSRAGSKRPYCVVSLQSRGPTESRRGQNTHEPFEGVTMVSFFWQLQREYVGYFFQFVRMTFGLFRSTI